MFDPVDPKQSFPALEHGILQYWKEEDTFKRSVKQRSSQKGRAWEDIHEGEEEVFSFYDGPPVCHRPPALWEPAPWHH